MDRPFGAQGRQEIRSDLAIGPVDNGGRAFGGLPAKEARNVAGSSGVEQPLFSRGRG